MAEIICCGSSSEGNAYILKCDNEALLVELGVPFREIRRALNNDISMVKAALVTHVHSDHSEYIPQAQQKGISVYSCQEVADKYKRVNVIKVGQEEKERFGGFFVQPVHVPHNVECYSFLITHEEFGRLWFITDCREFTLTRKHAPNVNHIFIECNYAESVIIDRMCETNKGNDSRSEHHMELSKTIKALKNNYSPDLMTVGLLHLSNGNSDENMFRQRVVDELGFHNIVVMDKGVSIPLQLSEF